MRNCGNEKSKLCIFILESRDRASNFQELTLVYFIIMMFRYEYNERFLQQLFKYFTYQKMFY